MSVAMIVVAGFGLALIAVGAYYHIRKTQLQSDPVLITTCYVWGVLNVAACLVSQMPSEHSNVPEMANTHSSHELQLVQVKH